MHSRSLQLKSLNNARTLAGIINKNGLKIKENKLIRSNALYRASDEDIKTLYEKYDVRTVVDLRGDKERRELPDKLYADQRLIENGIMADLAAGITRDKESQKQLELNWDIPAIDGKNRMKGFYQVMAEEYATNMYKKFMKEVLANDSAILWHCAMGKDRCGVASVIILSALDVDKDSIIEDYLYTNECIHSGEKFEETARNYANWVNEEYITSYFDTVEKLYGSMDIYLKDKLAIGEEEKKILAEKYLQKD